MEDAYSQLSFAEGCMFLLTKGNWLPEKKKQKKPKSYQFTLLHSDENCPCLHAH